MKISKSTRRFVLEILIFILAITILSSIVSPVVVRGVSMQNTFENNDFLIMNKRAPFDNKDIKPGTIIIFQQDKRQFIKRVIAVEGDNIEIKDGAVYVNDKLIKEDYLENPTTPGSVARKKIPQGKLFVLGDNRQNSLDSRDEEVGLVDIESVIGKPVVRLFPFSSIGTVAPKKVPH